MRTSKLRDLTPVPQVLVQELQEFQACTQSMGQGWVLQLSRAIRVGQATPPLAAELMTERVLELTPPPHFSVQVEERPQWETLQSTGQPKVLHLALAVSLGQATPPWALLTTIERLLILRGETLPATRQESEQPANLDQAETTQPTGQRK
jgi:hypothetical protein